MRGGPGAFSFNQHLINTALTESHILGPSEAFRAPMDCIAHASQTFAMLERLARGLSAALARAQMMS